MNTWQARKKMLKDMEELRRRFEEHMHQDNTNFERISASIDKIKDNHLAHMQASMTAFESKLGAVETDIKWLKWGVMLVVGGIVAVYFK